MIIYKVTNLKNNKIYIGQSTRSLEERKRHHYLECKHINDNTYFHNALRKYNPVDFKWEILEENIEDQLELDNLEICYIKLFDTTNRNKCYNIKLGGNGGGNNSEETRRKIGLKTKERWNNPEISMRMKTGLLKGVETMKRKALLNYIRRTCPHCGNTFMVKPSSTKKFCSNLCRNESLKLNNKGLIFANRKNKDNIEKIRRQQLSMIKDWVLHNYEIIKNVKFNKMSNIFLPLKSLLNVKDDRSVCIILNTRSRKKFVKELSKMYAELVGNNENQEIKSFWDNKKEQPLIKNGACLLSAINLSEYVLNPFTNNVSFDYKSLGKDIPIIYKAMNDVLDEGLEKHALKEQREAAKNWRNIGIGITGLAEMFIKFQTPYGSKKSITLARDIMRFLFQQCLYNNIQQGKEYGSFPKFDIENKYGETNIVKNSMRPFKIESLRNCSMLTVAPTGSISNLIGVSSMGVEPVFAFEYKRRTVSLNGEEKVYSVYPKIVNDYLNLHPEDSINNLPYYFVSAYDIDWKSRIDMQSVIQEYVDSAIKTCGVK